MANKTSKKKKKSNKKTKCVYILVSKTSTLPSTVIKMWTREPYAHTSLALDLELKEMYSFARKKLRNPFDCGFISEDITTGVFGRDVGTTCKIARLWITEEQHRKVLEILEKFKKDRAFYGYNYIGIFGVVFNKAVERKYNYFCSQFVFHVLDKAGVKMFNKKPGLARPEDFRVWDELEFIYEGKLNQYRDYLKDNYPKDKNGNYIEKKGIMETTTKQVAEIAATFIDSSKREASAR